MTKIDIDVMREEFTIGDAKRDSGLVEPSSLEKIRNLSYGPYGKENTFDIYYPKGTNKPLPTIINFHGGGFFYGDKELYRFYTMFLATQGFTVINFNYRLAPEHKYPAPLEDMNRLMHWLIENGINHHVDLDRLFLVGDSAGGQLAEQYATIVSNPSYAALFEFSVAPVKFKAIALNCSAFFIGQDEPIDKDFPFYYLKGTFLEEQFPVENYITPDFPPAFVMTSSHDFLKEVAKPFATLLSDKGVSVEYHLYNYPDGSELEHVFHLDQKSKIARECNLAELTFFKNYL